MIPNNIPAIFTLSGLGGSLPDNITTGIDYKIYYFNPINFKKINSDCLYLHPDINYHKRQ